MTPETSSPQDIDTLKSSENQELLARQRLGLVVSYFIYNYWQELTDDRKTTLLRAFNLPTEDFLLPDRLQETLTATLVNQLAWICDWYPAVETLFQPERPNTRQIAGVPTWALTLDQLYAGQYTPEPYKQTLRSIANPLGVGRERIRQLREQGIRFLTFRLETQSVDTIAQTMPLNQLLTFHLEYLLESANTSNTILTCPPTPTNFRPIAAMAELYYELSRYPDVCMRLNAINLTIPFVGIAFSQEVLEPVWKKLPAAQYGVYFLFFEAKYNPPALAQPRTQTPQPDPDKIISPEELGRQEIRDMFSTRLANALIRTGITCLDDLINRSLTDFPKKSGIGKTLFAELYQKLKIAYPDCRLVSDMSGYPQNDYDIKTILRAA